MKTWHAILAAAALGAVQAPAQAATCYFVLNRGDSTIYRSTQPPVDMSDRGIAERDAMRARGEYLLFTETDNCAPITFLTGPGTPGTLSVDAIVAGIPTMAKAEGVSSGLAAPTRGGSGPSMTPRATSNLQKSYQQAPRR